MGVSAAETAAGGVHGFPVALTSFIGRDGPVREVADMLGRHRLVTVTGPGGSGKTRLGREACVQMLVAGWDAGLADDQRRDGTATTRLQRPTLLVPIR